MFLHYRVFGHNADANLLISCRIGCFAIFIAIIHAIADEIMQPKAIQNSLAVWAITRKIRHVPAVSSATSTDARTELKNSNQSK